jgi:hypothetical protein
VGSAALNAITAAVALLVAAAGAARLRDAVVERRLLGGVLLAAALAALVGLAPARLGPGPASAGLGVAIVHALLVTAAASSGFAFLRRVTQHPALVRCRPAAVGAGAALLQVVALVVAADRPEGIADVAVPTLVTAAWPAVTTGLAASVLRTLGGFAPRALRGGIALALVGCAAIGAGTALGSAGTAAALADGGAPGALAAASGVLGAGGLLLLGTGVVVPGLSERAAVVGRWITAVRVLRRARPLVRSLADVAGEWAPPWGTCDSPLRHPVEQAYDVLIFVRTASFTLHPLVDDVERQAARQHARRRAEGDEAVDALTEACWLALAITRRRAGHPARVEQDSIFLQSDAVPPTASVSTELAFLDALARAWARTGVLSAYVDAMTPEPRRAR